MCYPMRGILSLYYEYIHWKSSAQSLHIKIVCLCILDKMLRCFLDSIINFEKYEWYECWKIYAHDCAIQYIYLILIVCQNLIRSAGSKYNILLFSYVFSSLHDVTEPDIVFLIVLIILLIFLNTYRYMYIIKKQTMI